MNEFSIRTDCTRSTEENKDTSVTINPIESQWNIRQ